MIRGLLDGFRRGRDETIEEWRRRPFPERRRAEAAQPWPEPEPEPEPESHWDEPEPGVHDAEPGDGGRGVTDDDLVIALAAREAMIAENRQLIGELGKSIEQLHARITELETAADARDAKCKEYERLIGDLADSVEPLQARITELEEAAEPFAAVLTLPGVEKGLRTRFHPDTHPKADETEKLALNEATKMINAVYAAIKRRA
jgi:hypothetical protein